MKKKLFLLVSLIGISGLSAVKVKGYDVEPMADLSRANLKKANLAFANLIQADLSLANLTEAHLGRADLRAANLTFANLNFTNLTDADLTGADLEDCLRGADGCFRKANLEGANFDGATMPNGKLYDSTKPLGEQLKIVTE